MQVNEAPLTFLLCAWAEFLFCSSENDSKLEIFHLKKGKKRFRFDLIFFGVCVLTATVVWDVVKTTASVIFALVRVLQEQLLSRSCFFYIEGGAEVQRGGVRSCRYSFLPHS